MQTMKTKKLFWLIPLLIAVFAGGMIYLRGHSAKDLNSIRVSGNIEVIDAEVSFKIPGRVEERLFDEGQPIQAGKVVARLDAAELQREVALRRAESQEDPGMRSMEENKKKKGEWGGDP
jgi:HlyD family secretion protein